MSNKIIYTAIFGGYDTLRDPAEITPGADYICFTDKPQPSQVWNQILVQPTGNPILQAREIKILPPFRVKGKQTLWVDGNTQIMKDLTPVFQIAAQTGCIVAPKHPLRNCAYEEMAAVLMLKKDTPENVAKARSILEDIFYPEAKGLNETGMLCRNMNHDTLRHSLLWLHWLKNTSYRDQLTFNAAAYITAVKIFSLQPFEKLPYLNFACHNQTPNYAI